MTPGTLSKSDSTHQKQPPANVAFAVACAIVPVATPSSKPPRASARKNSRVVIMRLPGRR
jgi:hypothetical protein